MTDLKERLRTLEPCAGLSDEAADRIDYLEQRLEVAPGESESVDGISCRDETIKLLDARIARLETQLAEGRAVIEPFANADIDISGTAACGVTGDDILAARAFLSPTTPSCPRCGHTTDSEIHKWCQQKEPLK